MKTCLIFLLFLLPALFISGCSINSSDEGSVIDKNLSKKLIGKTWELRSVQENNYDTFAPEQDSMYTITFTGDSTFNAHEICNHCGGNYQIKESNRLAFSGFFCTEMACYGYQNSIAFSSTLGGESFPATITNNRLYLTIQEQDDFKRQYVFAEYSAAKDVLMANPEAFQKEEWPSGLYTITESELNKDILSLKVGISGCGPHEINLVFNNYFLESSPVQANAFVSHIDQECDAAFLLEEQFDLNPLKEAYQKYYDDSGTIDINIFQDNSEKITLRYTF